MATFDLQQQRMCVRVVYDGVASAGKTTNLRQLAELFSTQRTCEVISPAELHGRTLYFDWLQIAAGMVCGFPLLCQVITVPGQVVLTPRRRHLLATADVVVHVCDSDEAAAERAHDGIRLLEELEAERGERIPLVVQANKQDQAGATSGSVLSSRLGRPEVPVIEAIASDGIGVIDTFVAAVRAAVRSIQARVERGDVRVPVQQAETPGAVLAGLGGVAIDPEWEVEMMLEEASNAFALGAALAEEPVVTEDVEEVPVTRREVPPRTSPLPVLPTDDVPTGFIWPAHTGRAALRALADEPELAQPPSVDAAGGTCIVLRDFVLTTGQSQRFDTAESSRQALVRAAREQTQLGTLLAAETVLVAQPAGNGSSWLWTILPRMPSVWDLLESADAGSRGDSTLLAAYGSALVEALRVEARHARALDLSARSFGVRQGSVRFLGPSSVVERSVRDPAGAVVSALHELSALCDDLEPVMAAIESSLSTKLSADELGKLRGAATTPPPARIPPALRDARARLDAALRRGQEAA